MKVRRILIATDLSKESASSIRYASEKLLEKEDQITLLTLVLQRAVPEWPYEASAAYVRGAVEHARVELDQLVERYLSGFAVEKEVLVSANIPQEICDVAEERRADCIMLGSHGAGALVNLFIGNTIQRVIRLARIPVYVIPRSIERQVAS